MFHDLGFSLVENLPCSIEKSLKNGKTSYNEDLLLAMEKLLTDHDGVSCWKF